MAQRGEHHGDDADDHAERHGDAHDGDLDAAGFSILNAVRAHFPHTTSLLMDTATVTAFKHLAVPDPGDGSATLTHLTTEEQEAYRLLFTEGRLRIEQERIPFTHASDAVHHKLN